MTMLISTDEVKWMETEDDVSKILRMMSLFIAEPIDKDMERDYFGLLEIEFPRVNLLKELRKFYAWILDNPDRYDRSNPKFHIRFRKWCKRVDNNIF